jgi:hypothetical protein
MSDSLRNDENLTTADIARRPPTPRQVRSEVVYRGPADQIGNNALAPDSAPQAASNPQPAANSGNARGPVAVPPNTTAPDAGPLFPDDELHNYRARWDEVQASFVDEPRQAVEQADSLVANVVTRIAEQFSHERSKLEEQWSKGDNVNTEDLRQALRRYRSFFDRLLSF